MYYVPMTKANSMSREMTYENSEGVEVTVDLPLKWEICSDCSGAGQHDHPAFSNGVEQDILDDEESRESYFRGDYDVRCDSCDGSGKVKEVNTEGLNEEVTKAYFHELDEQAYNDCERDAERRAGC